MPLVISICEDSDDEQSPAIPNPQRVSLESATSQVIDLLESCSSSSDDEGVHAQQFQEARSSSPSVALDRKKSTHRELALASVNRSSLNNSPRNVTFDSHSSTPGGRRTKSSTAHSRADTDSDDDSILHFTAGFSKVPYQYVKSKRTAQNQVQNQSSASSTTPLTLLASAPRSKTSLINPYAKSPGSCNGSVNPFVKLPLTVTPALSEECQDFPAFSSSVSRTMRITHDKHPRLQTPPIASQSSMTASSVLTRTASPLSVVYPALLSNSKVYEDIRAKYILALWKYARSLTHHSHDRSKLDQITKKIIALALSDHPVRSVDEYCFRYCGGANASMAMGKEVRSTVLTQLECGGLTSLVTPVDACRDSRYYSIAEACLVAMRIEIHRRHLQQEQTIGYSHDSSLQDLDEVSLAAFLNQKESWLPLTWLIPQIDERLKEECPGRLRRPQDSDNGAAHWTNPSTRSAEYRQIEKLTVHLDKHQGQSYLKEHKRRGEIYFELTSLGYKAAMKIQQRCFPAPPGHYRCSNLINVEPKYHGICLGVDMREGGGSANVLHKM